MNFPEIVHHVTSKFDTQIKSYEMRYKLIHVVREEQMKFKVAIQRRKVEAKLQWLIKASKL